MRHAFRLAVCLTAVAAGVVCRVPEGTDAVNLPTYVHPSEETIISGSGFLSRTTGWIARSTSRSYVPHGSCANGISSNCNSAATTVYGTHDAGHHWTSLLRFVAESGSPVWIRLFTRYTGLVAATVGPLTSTATGHVKALLFSTRDAGRHWRRFPLPANYSPETGTISFPDPQHGWLWYGGGALGSMSVFMYRTTDGGRHWNRVACTPISNARHGSECRHSSGIKFGGDKDYLTFSDPHHGWFTEYDNAGGAILYYTRDGGTSWWQQKFGLHTEITILLQPRFFNRIGVLPEEVGPNQPVTHASWHRLYVSKSSDGGRTWTNRVRTPISARFGLWQAVDSQHWVFISSPTPASRQKIWSTGNAGTSWTTHIVVEPKGLTITGTNLVTSRYGWAMASIRTADGSSSYNTVLLQTADGGVHWVTARVP